MHRLHILLLYVALSGATLLPAAALGVPPASDSDNPFTQSQVPPTQPFSSLILSGPDTVAAGSEVELRYRLRVPEDHWVYQERSGIELLPGPGYEIIGVTAPPAETKFDPFLEHETQVYKHDVDFTARVRMGWTAPVRAVIRYQGCNNSFCFFPQADTLETRITVVGAVATEGSVPPSGASPQVSGAAGTDGAMGKLQAAAARGLFWLLLLAFLAGIGTSFTPCVYPMIPITIGIIGARSAGSRLKGFSLSLAYVLGIAVTYSALGTTAALTGSLFGSILQNRWVIVFVSLVFTLMAMSLFGAFELQVPAWVSGRTGRVRGSGYPGAFALGLVAGIVASPCVGPILVAMLAYVGTSGNVVLGFSLFFTFALGLGMLFIALGTFTGLIASIPKSGNWLLAVRTIFGLVFLGVALYYLHPFLPKGPPVLVVGLLLLALGLALRGLRRIDEIEPPAKRWGKAFGRTALVAGAYAVVASLVVGSPREPAAAGPRWLATEAEGVRVATAEKKPLLVDFSAEWCVACKELERFTFSDPRVIERAKEFITVRVDATRQTPEIQSLIRKYGISGLPWVAFVMPDGRILKEHSVTGYIDAEAMLERMQQVLDARVTRAAS
jgi:thiol:disulfide interchange protein DsbD